MTFKKPAVYSTTLRARFESLNAKHMQLVGQTFQLDPNSTLKWTVSELVNGGVKVTSNLGATATVRWDEKIYLPVL